MYVHFDGFCASKLSWTATFGQALVSSAIVLQLSKPALMNIPPMVVAWLTFHPRMSWLTAEASVNIK